MARDIIVLEKKNVYVSATRLMATRVERLLSRLMHLSVFCQCSAIGANSFSLSCWMINEPRTISVSVVISLCVLEYLARKSLIAIAIPESDCSWYIFRGQIKTLSLKDYGKLRPWPPEPRHSSPEYVSLFDICCVRPTIEYLSTRRRMYSFSSLKNSMLLCNFSTCACNCSCAISCLTCSFRLGFWPLNFLARAFSCILGEFVIFLWADLEGGE